MNAETGTDFPSLKDAADFGSLVPWLPPIVHWEVDELGATSHVDAPTSPNVSVHELTAAALHVSERLVRQFFDESPIGVAVFEPRGRLVRVNRAFGEMLGYDVVDLKARQIEELIHRDDVAAHQENCRRLIEGACDKFETEIRFLPANRREIWARVCGQLACYASYEPPYIFAHIMEMAEPRPLHDHHEFTTEELLLGSWWEPNCSL